MRPIFDVQMRSGREFELYEMPLLSCVPFVSMIACSVREMLDQTQDTE